MKRLIFGIITMIFLAGCATAPVEQDEARSPDFPLGFGTAAERTVAEETQQRPPADPITTVEAAEAEPESSDLPPVPGTPMVTMPEVPEVEPWAAETPDAPVLAEITPVKPEGDQLAVGEPETELKPAVPGEPVLAAETRESISETAAKEVEDSRSTLFRAAWIGLPVLLLLLVILVVEMVRWAVYKKPLFGWTTGLETAAAEGMAVPQADSVRKPGVFRRISQRFSRFLDKVYEDLDDADESDSEDKEI